MDILKRIFISLVTIAVFGSCMEDFEPESGEGSVLCLNAMITAGEPVALSVTHTWRYSKPVVDPTVGDADVELYVDGKFVECLVYGETVEPDESSGNNSRFAYISNYLPRIGDRLEFKARSDRYGEAMAKVTVPQVPVLDKVIPEIDLTNVWFSDNEDGSYAIDLRFRLNVILDISDVDPADNYFVFDWASGFLDDEIEPETGLNFSLGNLNYDAEPLFSEHISTFESIMGSDAWGFSVFSDRRFAGKNYKLKARYDDCIYYIWTGYMSPDELEARLHPTVVVSVDNISKSYYDWLIYDWHVDNGFTGSMSDIGFADAIIANSNVSTGAGVVAARARTTHTIDLNDFIMETINNLLKSKK